MHDPYKKGFDMLLGDIQAHEARCATPSRCEPFSTKLSAEGINRLGDTIADLRMQVKEMVDTMRMAREALDNDEFALCAGMIDAAMKVGADKTANSGTMPQHPATRHQASKLFWPAV